MNVSQVASIAAYEIDASKGGGFRGAMLVDGVRTCSDRLDTLSAARFWAQNEAYKAFGNRNGYNLAPLRRNGEYRANVWIAV